MRLLSCRRFNNTPLGEVNYTMKKILPLLGTVALSVALLLGGVYAGYQISAARLNAPSVATESIEQNEVLAVGPVGSISIPGYDRITLQAGQRTQRVALVNPPENSCYFKITLLLADGTELYQSGLLAPGTQLNSIKLETMPAAGSYADAVLRYTCWAADESGALTEANGADTICTLEVLQ